MWFSPTDAGFMDEAALKLADGWVEKAFSLVGSPVRDLRGQASSEKFDTQHTLKNQGKRAMPLNDGENPKLDPITEVGSGKVQDKQKAFLEEIIRKVNDLFEGDLTPQDKLVYVNNVIKGKLLKSETLKQQARCRRGRSCMKSGMDHARILLEKSLSPILRDLVNIRNSPRNSDTILRSDRLCPPTAEESPSG